MGTPTFLVIYLKSLLLLLATLLEKRSLSTDPPLFFPLLFSHLCIFPPHLYIPLYDAVYVYAPSSLACTLWNGYVLKKRRVFPFFLVLNQKPSPL